MWSLTIGIYVCLGMSCFVDLKHTDGFKTKQDCQRELLLVPVSSDKVASCVKR